ncbi:hypothetical protein G7Z99_10120 [Pseudomonas entomophila]|uniref:hypothetical protein n=1 Tax=Pseudomonas entomophila TaxID=312306 RepID=UPI0015E409CD|nr:hypothetical protein [Pseudomonas entomophila]MBA1189399.1 hypothetical protein [Pseudomonas entomophila]
MRTKPRLITANIGLSLVSFIAWPLALAFSGLAVASDYTCDGFIGSFAVRPEDKSIVETFPPRDEVVLKVVKDDAGFALMAKDSASDQWVRIPLKVGLPEEKEKEMRAEGGTLPDQLTCALSTEGLFLLQFSAGSGDNPSESEDRDRRRYPQKTPYVMFAQAGFVAGGGGLYRVTAPD